MEKKPIEEITLDDMKRYPIWIFDYENESDEEEDETWQKPVTNSTDVTKDIYEAYIHLRSDDAVYDLSGCIDVDKLTLTDLCFWDSISKVWVPVVQINNYQVLKLIAVPSVLSQSDMKFEYDENSNSFTSAVKSDRPSLNNIKRYCILLVKILAFFVISLVISYIVNYLTGGQRFMRDAILLSLVFSCYVAFKDLRSKR